MKYTAELAQLMKFTGDTATAIRMYSPYNKSGLLQGQRRDPHRSQVDLMFLADVLHRFSSLGFALEEGDSANIVVVCDKLLSEFTGYETERPEYGELQAKPTFDFWEPLVNLKHAREALLGIRSKAALLQQSYSPD